MDVDGDQPSSPPSSSSSSSSGDSVPPVGPGVAPDVRPDIPADDSLGDQYMSARRFQNGDPLDLRVVSFCNVRQGEPEDPFYKQHVLPPRDQLCCFVKVVFGFLILNAITTDINTASSSVFLVYQYRI